MRSQEKGEQDSRYSGEKLPSLSTITSDTAQLQLKFQAAKFYAQTKAGWGKEEKTLKILAGTFKNLIILSCLLTTSPARI